MSLHTDLFKKQDFVLKWSTSTGGGSYRFTLDIPTDATGFEVVKRNEAKEADPTPRNRRRYKCQR